MEKNGLICKKNAAVSPQSHIETGKAEPAKVHQSLRSLLFASLSLLVGWVKKGDEKLLPVIWGLCHKPRNKDP